MNLEPAQRKLTSSIEDLIQRADHRAVERIHNESKGRALQIGALFSSGHVMDDAKIVYEVIEDALPDIFKAYDAERSRYWFRGSSLNSTVRQGVTRFYEGMERVHQQSDSDWLLHMNHELYVVSLKERMGLTMRRVEEHFRHPGVLPVLQRHPIAALIATNLLTFLLTILGRALVK